MDAYSRDRWARSLAEANPSDFKRISSLLDKLQSSNELCSGGGPVLDGRARKSLDKATPQDILEAFVPVERHYRERTCQNVSAVLTSSLNDSKHRQRRSRPDRMDQGAPAPASPRSASSVSSTSSKDTFVSSPVISPPAMPKATLAPSDLLKHASFALIILACQLMKDNGIDVPASFGLLYDRSKLWVKRDNAMVALRETDAWWGLALTELLQGLADQEQCANMNLYVSGQKVWLQKETVSVRLV